MNSSGMSKPFSAHRPSDSFAFLSSASCLSNHSSGEVDSSVRSACWKRKTMSKIQKLVCQTQAYLKSLQTSQTNMRFLSQGAAKNSVELFMGRTVRYCLSEGNQSSGRLSSQLRMTEQCRDDAVGHAQAREQEVARCVVIRSTGLSNYEGSGTYRRGSEPLVCQWPRSSVQWTTLCHRLADPSRLMKGHRRPEERQS